MSGIKTYGLVLCQSADGWSLHAPGSKDEQIACGDARYINCGEGEPTQRDYDEANRLFAQANKP